MACLAVLAIASCAPPSPPPEVSSSLEIAPLEPGRVALAEPDAGPPALPSPPNAGPPPSGEYDVRVEVLSDTCATPKGAPPPLTVFVPVRANGGQVVASLPLPEARATGIGMSRHDVRLDEGASDHPGYTSHPFPRECPTYERTRTSIPTVATAHRIELRVEWTYGDFTGCPRPSEPSRCSSEHRYVYELKTKLCEPTCKVSYAPRGLDAGGAVQCFCP